MNTVIIRHSAERSDNMSEQAYICCFCGRAFKGWGNNPAPVNKDEKARCCDDCNSNIIIPARLYLMQLNAREK